MPVVLAHSGWPGCAVPTITGAPLAVVLAGLACRPSLNWLVEPVYSIGDQSETPCALAARTWNRSDACGSSPLMIAPAP